MSNPEDQKPGDEDFATSLAFWIAIGVALGSGLGIAMDNIGVGVGIGIAVCTAIGMFVSSKRRRK